MVHFSYNSYHLTISQFLNFLQFLAYEVVFLYNLRNSTGPKSIFGSETFFRIFFSPKGPTFNFLIFLDRMDFEKSQIPPFSFLRHCETFFRKKIPEKGPQFTNCRRLPPVTALGSRQLHKGRRQLPAHFPFISQKNNQTNFFTILLL